jgi:hypothetical protein
MAFLLLIVATFFVHNNGTAATRISVRSVLAHLGGSIAGSVAAALEVVHAVNGGAPLSSCARQEMSTVVLTVAIAGVCATTLAHHCLQLLTKDHKVTSLMAYRILAIFATVCLVALVIAFPLISADRGIFVLVAAITGASIVLPAAHSNTVHYAWLNTTITTLVSLCGSWGALMLFHAVHEMVGVTC